jgi:O-antigen/teichoic acid export membrane protein
VKNTLRQQPVINTIVYFSALLLNIFFGWFLTKINTNHLTVSAYGQLAFFITFISLSRSIFSFGVFESTSRLLAITNEPVEKSRLLGSSLILALVFSLMATSFVYLSGIVIDDIFEVNIGEICQQFSIGVGLFVLLMHMNLALRGTGQIKTLSLMTVGSRLSYLILLLVVIQYGRFSLSATLSMMFAGMTVILILGWLYLKPSFKNLNVRMTIIWREVKSYGRHIYLSSIWSELLIHVDKILISFFLDSQAMAYYGLAFAISFPLTHFSNSMATSLFNRFATDDKLTRKVLLGNLLFVSTTVTLFIILREPIVLYLFSAQYAPTIELLPPLALGFGFSGLSKPFTLFLMAQKQGKIVRNISILLPSLQIMLGIFIIPMYGLIGAAWVACFVYGLDLVLYIITYRRFVG